jgi:ribosomal protein S20
MPKEAQNTMLKRLVKEFNKMGNNYSTDEEIISCNSCEKRIVVKKRYDMTQQSNIATHRLNLRKLKEKANSGQQLISQSFNKTSSQILKLKNKEILTKSCAKH